MSNADPEPKKSLADEALAQRIRGRNPTIMRRLQEQLRSPVGVIPFVGAGISAGVTLSGDPSRFPKWDVLLESLGGDGSIATEVKSLIVKQQYEAAAELVDKARPNVLPLRIRDTFHRTVPDAQLRGEPLCYLPLLASGPVITTNYDNVLEQTFKAAGQTFAGQTFEDVIVGPEELKTIAAVHRNQRVLLKIHGDCQAWEDHVFTASSYEKAYAPQPSSADNPSPARVGNLSWLLFTNRPLLFLGCSLENDRTVKVLGAIRAQFPGIEHFAVLATERTAAEWEERERFLDALGIRPLWYAPGKYSQISDLLREAVEGASTTLIAPTLITAPPAAAPAAQRITIADIPTLLPNTSFEREPDDHAVALDMIVSDLLNGELAFFLGAYAGLDRALLGNPFYRGLEEQFKTPALEGDRTAAAEFIIRQYGSERAWAAVRPFFESASRPSAVHRIIAAMPAFLRDHGRSSRVCVLTTNYDTAMEQALTEAAEPFVLLYYRSQDADGTNCFYERSPSGVIRRIDRPETLLRGDTDSHLLVKLNGGLAYFRDIPEQVSVVRSQFERLAGRIPGILPGYLRRDLKERALLFLGHGLAEPDVRAVIETYGSRPDNAIRTWALRLGPEDPRLSLQWQRMGIDILYWDLEHFILSLHQALIKRAARR